MEVGNAERELLISYISLHQKSCVGADAISVVGSSIAEIEKQSAAITHIQNPKTNDTK